MSFSHSKNKNLFLVFLALVLIGTFFLGYTHRLTPVTYQTAAEKNPYVRFDMEAYDSIVKNYWKLSTTTDMVQLFQLSLQKSASLTTVPTPPTPDRAGVAAMLATEFSHATSTSAEKNLALNTLIVALYNLAPQGRDGLLSSGQETELRQTVANVDQSHNLYQDLGLEKGANASEVESAFVAKKTELAKLHTPEALAQLNTVSYAHGVLTNAANRQMYDQSGVEPTVFPHTFGSVLYLYIDKISPTTIGEFARAVDTASTTPGLSSMIIDLRGNVGGDLSFPQYFLGLFLGKDQYAFDQYHQGNYIVQRTVLDKFPELDRYKEYALITDGQTQSTAELLTGTLKRFNIAHVVGTKTRGWGSVENTYPLTTSIDPKEKYSLLLVNSLTLRDDNQPIESNGVLPNVDTSTAGWTAKLPSYFREASLIQTLTQVATAKPLRY